VIVNAGGDGRVCQLQQNRTPPSGDDNHLAIDLPRGAAGTGAMVSGLVQPRPDGVTMPLESLASLRYRSVHTSKDTGRSG
jgi:hypothetical protein